MKPVQEYILHQPQKYREMLLHIMSVVENTVQEATLLFKWGVPYFYCHKKPFCYLAPNHKKGFVDIGFAKGFALKTNLEYLVDENRNTVKSLRYFTLESIDNTVLIAVLKEAISLYK
jgi:hypothetical protein